MEEREQVVSHYSIRLSPMYWSLNILIGPRNCHIYKPLLDVYFLLTSFQECNNSWCFLHSLCKMHHFAFSTKKLSACQSVPDLVQPLWREKKLGWKWRWLKMLKVFNLGWLNIFWIFKRSPLWITLVGKLLIIKWARTLYLRLFPMVIFWRLWRSLITPMVWLKVFKVFYNFSCLQDGYNSLLESKVHNIDHVHDLH